MLPSLLLAMLVTPPADPPAPVEAKVSVSGASLAVTLTLPVASAGSRVPAVLLLPGSGPSTRPQARAFVEAFQRAGLAVLTFDKRGCGESTGSWLTTSLDDMAADGRILLDWLKTRPEIEGTRVGL